MLEILKEMQEQGIFKLCPTDVDLDTLINEASTNDDIVKYIEDIKSYINCLCDELESRYSVSIGNAISDFYDKFNYELFNIYLQPGNVRTGVYQKEMDYKTGGSASVGLKSTDIKFTLEERKLIKLVNHYYISLKSKDNFDDKMFYIPNEQIKRMFSVGKNHKDIKDTLVETCKRISDKQIFWDFKETKYKKRIKQYVTCNRGMKLLDLVIIYQLWGTKGSLCIKGVLCRVNSLLNLRYSLNQMSYKFPTACLSEKYLEYVISDRILYYIHLKMKRNKNGYWIKTLKEFTQEIYSYDTNKPLAISYYDAMKRDKHKPREQEKLLKAIIKTTECYATNHQYFKCKFYLVVKDVPIILNGKNFETLYEEIIKTFGEPRAMQEVFNLYDKLKETGFMDDEFIVKYCRNNKYIKISKKQAEEYFDNFYDYTSGEINLDRLKQELIKKIDKKSTNILQAIDKDNISLKIEYSTNCI